MKFSTPLRYFLYGAAFGMMFPFGATIFQFVFYKLPFTINSFVSIHKETPILFMIDSAPLFLGLFALMGGKSKEKLEFILYDLRKTAETLSLHAGKLNKISSGGLLYLDQNTNHLNHKIIEINQLLLNLSGYIENTQQNIQLLDNDAQQVVYKTTDLIKSSNKLQLDNSQLFQDIMGFVSNVNDMNIQLKKIKSLGFEINTLALNSSIEAYKLGAQASGFAVIARNIKGLSDEIAKINDSLDKTSTHVEVQISSVIKRLEDRKENVDYIQNLTTQVEKMLNNYEENLRQMMISIKSSSKLNIEQKEKLMEVSQLFSSFMESKENIIQALNGLINEETNLTQNLMDKV